MDAGLRPMLGRCTVITRTANRATCRVWARNPATGAVTDSSVALRSRMRSSSGFGLYGRSLQPHEVVDIICSNAELPRHLLGTRAVVLMAVDAERLLAYEVECVADDGNTVWQGSLPRDLLKAG